MTAPMTPAQQFLQSLLTTASAADTSKVRGARIPFPGPGRFPRVLLAETEVDEEKPHIMWVRSVVVESATGEAPHMIAQRFDLTAQPMYPESPSQAAMLAALLNAATGVPLDGSTITKDPSTGASVEVVNPDSRLRALMADLFIGRKHDNLLRGVAYALEGRYSKKASAEHGLASNGRQYKIRGRGPSGELLLDMEKERFVHLTYSSVAGQTDEQVVAARAWLDEHFPVKPRGRRPAATPAQVVAGAVAAAPQAWAAPPVTPPTSPAPGSVPVFRLPGQ